MSSLTFQIAGLILHRVALNGDGGFFPRRTNRSCRASQKDRISLAKALSSEKWDKSGRCYYRSSYRSKY